MDKQPDSLPTAETNHQSSYPPFQIAAPHDTEADKWDLGWLVTVARRRGLLMAGVALGTTLLAGGCLFLITKSTPAEYLGKFQLLVEPITAEDQLARSSTRAQGSEEPNVQRINIEQSSLDYESQIQILRGPKLLEAVVKQSRQRYPDVTYETLIKNLKIARLTTLSLDKKEQGTKLIDVSYQDTDPEKIKFILERLSQTYLNYSLKERQSTIRRGIQFIDSQLSPLRQRVDSLQRQIQVLRQRYTIVDPEQQGKLLTENAVKLDQIKADNQTQLAEATAKRDALLQQLQDDSPQSVLGETAYYQTLLNQYQQVEGQIAIESARLKPDNPAMQALLEKRQNLQSLLNREANRVVEKTTASIAVADARRQVINRLQAEMTQKIRQLPAIAREYNDLQRELAIATDSLNKFSTRQEALQIDAAQQEIPWELTVPPKLQLDASGKPAPINRISQVRFLAIIAVLAILLGIGVGFLVETTQDLLHTIDEVKRASKLPLLGSIPPLGSPNAFSLNPWQHSIQPKKQIADLLNHSVLITHPPQVQSPTIPASEAFRSLCKNIRLLAKYHTPIRALTISSAESGDGKSTIALHLALTAAAMGQRVLLVDADLRHPQIHSLVGLDNQQGLSDLLSRNQDVKNVLRSLPGHHNLMILTSGQPSTDAAEVFTSPRIEPLFQELQDMFDLVIYDTPPLVGVADSSLVAAQSGHVALVVRLGKTKRSSIAAALAELEFSSTKVLGIVANDDRTVPANLTYYPIVQTLHKS
jgi:polysaccharide biosynthesis transport protein